MKKDDPYHDNSMFKGAPAENFKKAEKLRSNMTEAELILWSKLKDNQWGFKFRRQHPIHLFIVDFYCHQKKLVIEIDGAYHNAEEQINRDKERTMLLKFQDLNIIRFTNDDVVNKTNQVLKKIEKELNSFPL
ncbi:endonuclease domain-containing protein [Antarcticibacterium sp. 1MA-6-2]|uniref:endonuclease domain-containing protein n=1 Tax=Antarcticibacterium sp. 1MA-6-2 TaxID=2908210 RepID=UPI001F2A4992|nr:endonuclease domain-containing protein [Antarcticibacterium sp. 1MA-6-2]UJH92539.1 endonuclease domain-containing protein [Antarcticibacterium sp. 1MA-6-2]